MNIQKRNRVLTTARLESTEYRTDPGQGTNGCFTIADIDFLYIIKSNKNLQDREDNISKESS